MLFVIVKLKKKNTIMSIVKTKWEKWGYILCNLDKNESEFVSKFQL